jgi:hypothetical protein
MHEHVLLFISLMLIFFTVVDVIRCKNYCYRVILFTIETMVTKNIVILKLKIAIYNNMFK